MSWPEKKIIWRLQNFLKMKSYSIRWKKNAIHWRICMQTSIFRRLSVQWICIGQLVMRFIGKSERISGISWLVDIHIVSVGLVRLRCSIVQIQRVLILRIRLLKAVQVIICCAWPVSYLNIREAAIWWIIMIIRWEIISWHQVVINVMVERLIFFHLVRVAEKNSSFQRIPAVMEPVWRADSAIWKIFMRRMKMRFTLTFL